MTVKRRRLVFTTKVRIRRSCLSPRQALRPLSEARSKPNSCHGTGLPKRSFTSLDKRESRRPMRVNNLSRQMNSGTSMSHQIPIGSVCGWNGAGNHIVTTL
jgi:hypothetical protein